MIDEPTYEEQFNPLTRRIRRAARRVSWTLKGLVGSRRRILVEINWRLGDEIMALPIYPALQQHYPDAEIVVRCKFPELVDGFETNSAVHPDKYVLLRDAARNVTRIDHYASLAKIPAPDARPQVHASPSDEDWAGHAGRRIAIAPGATWPTKRWSPQNWRGLCNNLTDSGFDVLILGNSGEGFAAGRDITGRTSVSDCARILAGADLCVSCDSGLMHLALAVGTRVVALFGPTNPKILARDHPLLHVITNERDCRFCWNDSQEMSQPGLCPRSIQGCLDTIPVSTVLERVQNLLGMPTPSP